MRDLLSGCVYVRTYIHYLDPLIVSENKGSSRDFFYSRNTSRNMCGYVQGEVQLLPRISCWNVRTWQSPLGTSSYSHA